jgi:hypothetical protein
MGKSEPPRRCHSFLAVLPLIPLSIQSLGVKLKEGKW